MTSEEYSKLPHFHMVTDLTNALMQKTSQHEPHFFRLLCAYFFTLIAAKMHASIDTPDRGLFPINLYAISLASSGFGKGHSVSIITEQVMTGFMEEFTNRTMPIVVEKRMLELSVKRAQRSGDDQSTEEDKVRKEFMSTGPYLPVFDSGTTAAFKQLRAQLLMSTIGCLNMRTDELGSNLSTIQEILTTFIEAFDVGVVNPKLIKHTKEQERVSLNEGRTPPMWLGFGTPTKVLDGGKTEAEFMENLETGLARRAFFGYCIDEVLGSELTPEQIFDLRTNSNANTYLTTLNSTLANCADVSKHKKKIYISKEISIKLIEYEMHNKAKAQELSEHRSIERAELLHRHAKVLKLAGAFAFVNDDVEITEEILHAAIRMGEDSGKHFELIMRREPAHVRLARFIGSAGKPLTQAELVDTLPFYKGTETAKREMMLLACSYSMRHNISISRTFTAGVEEIIGTMLKPTDISKVTFSYSSDFAHNYLAKEAPFDKLFKLITQPNLHWTTHAFKQSHRTIGTVISGFNLLVLDVDDGMSIDTAKLVLKDYTYLIHTTKSHGLIKGTSGNMIDKFRVVLPLSHTLKLSADQYTEFMTNVFDALPFAVDTATKDISRKWGTHPGQYWYNTGMLWDVLPFIPSTTAADEQHAKISALYSLTNLERWFVANTANGNRSNHLYRYGQMLVDSNCTLDTVKNAVEELNLKLPEPIKQTELDTTIFRTLHRNIIKRDANV